MFRPCAISKRKLSLIHGPNLPSEPRLRSKVDRVLFADDNLSPLSLTRADQIDPVLALYERYTRVGELNINVQKSAILWVNCSSELTQELRDEGFRTPATVQHFFRPGTWNWHEHYTEGNSTQHGPESLQTSYSCHSPSNWYIFYCSEPLWLILPWNYYTIMSSWSLWSQVRTFNPHTSKSFPSYVREWSMQKPSKKEV